MLQFVAVNISVDIENILGNRIELSEEHLPRSGVNHSHPGHQFSENPAAPGAIVCPYVPINPASVAASVMASCGISA